MSKSLGNSPDLLDLIDKYGADAVRFGIMISSPAEMIYCLMIAVANKEEISIIKYGTR